MYQKNRKGLTLIELLIVVIILGVLAALAIPRITTSAVTAKTNTCLTNQDTQNMQIELYYQDNSAWPGSLATVAGDANYFPDGAPTCPGSGTYSMSGTTYRTSCDVAGH